MESGYKSFAGAPVSESNEKLKEPLPKSIGEVPHYIRRMLTPLKYGNAWVVNMDELLLFVNGKKEK